MCRANSFVKVPVKRDRLVRSFIRPMRLSTLLRVNISQRYILEQQNFSRYADIGRRRETANSEPNARWHTFSPTVVESTDPTTVVKALAEAVI